MGQALFLAVFSVAVAWPQVDDQVFQRDGSGRASIPLRAALQAPSGKSLEARVLRKHLVVSDWEPVNDAVTAASGGPYRIEIRVRGASTLAAAVNNILVGDLWVLAGQSNMEGVGDLVNTTAPHEMVHNFDLADHWAVAEDPLHTLPSAADRVHWRRNPQGQPERLDGDAIRNFVAARKKGAGLGLPFAVEMVRRTGVPVGLLSCAHGGTSMDQWDPALKEKGGDSLYGSMLRRIHAAGGKLAGVLWYQGESDANPKAAAAFQTKFERFVQAMRSDLGQAELPFYYVQIGRHVNATNVAEWNAVQEMQRKAETTIPRSGMIAAVDTSLDDGIHVGTQDHKRLGRRLANLACHDLYPDKAGCGAYQRGPRPVAAVLRDGVVRVTFTGVNGRLLSPGRIAGFTVHDASGMAQPLVYKTTVDPSDPSAILLSIGGILPEGAVLRYGFGKDPYCNLRDSEDMAAPVFGPLPIAR